jgi:hypothetical protein
VFDAPVLVSIYDRNLAKRGKKEKETKKAGAQDDTISCCWLFHFSNFCN